MRCFSFSTALVLAVLCRAQAGTTTNSTGSDWRDGQWKRGSCERGECLWSAPAASAASDLHGECHPPSGAWLPPPPLAYLLRRAFGEGWNRGALAGGLATLASAAPAALSALVAPSLVTRSWSTAWVRLRWDNQTATPNGGLLVAGELPVVKYRTNPWLVCWAFDGLAGWGDAGSGSGGGGGGDGSGKDGGGIGDTAKEAAAAAAAQLRPVVAWVRGTLGCSGDGEKQATLQCDAPAASGTVTCSVSPGLPAWYETRVWLEESPEAAKRRKQSDRGGNGGSGSGGGGGGGTASPPPLAQHPTLSHCAEVDSGYFVRLALGALLLNSAAELAASRLFHYVFMAAVSVLVLAVSVLLLLWRSINRGAEGALPFGGMLGGLGGLGGAAQLLFPTLLVPKVWEGAEWLLWTCPAYFWALEQLGPVPHPGKLVLALAVLLSCWVTCTYRVFLPPVGEDGEEDEDEGEQRGWLEAAVWWAGVALVVASTRNHEFGIALAVLFASWDEIAHVLFALRTFFTAENAADFATRHRGGVMAEADFEAERSFRNPHKARARAVRISHGEEQETTTERALRELRTLVQGDLNADPVLADQMRKVTHYASLVKFRETGADTGGLEDEFESSGSMAGRLRAALTLVSRACVAVGCAALALHVANPAFFNQA